MLNFVMCDDNLNALNKLSHMFESVFMKYDLKAQIAFTFLCKRKSDRCYYFRY